jgi:hypothetical protein
MMGLCLLLVMFILSSITHNLFTTTMPTAVLGQGAQQAINDTGQFVGNVSETIAENPVVGNATQETQEFFAEKSK